MEPAAVAADPGMATAMAMATEEEGVAAEAAAPTSFGAFAALNGAVETVKMLLRAAMRRIVRCRSRSEGIACTIHNYVDSIYLYTCINRSY